MKKLIIFDLDGTLLYTLEDLTNSVNFTLDLFGYPKRTLEEITSFVGNGVQHLLRKSLPSSIVTLSQPSSKCAKASHPVASVTLCGMDAVNCADKQAACGTSTGSLISCLTWLVRLTILLYWVISLPVPDVVGMAIMCLNFFPGKAVLILSEITSVGWKCPMSRQSICGWVMA